MSIQIPVTLQGLLDRPVAIFGGGVSGRAVLGLLERLGAAGVVYDERAGEGSVAEFGATQAAGHRLAVFSPGFRVEHRWLRCAAEAGCVCLGELDFASLFWKGRIVSITGTNGKTTLTEFLTHALKARGLRAHATGNIGYSFTRLVTEQQGGEADTWAVCEVSSFQAEVLWHFETEGVLWTNFAEDHLERHPGMAAYFSAKNELCLHARRGMVFAGSSTMDFAAKLGFVMPEGSLVRTVGLRADPALAGTVFDGWPQRENFELASAWWIAQGFARAELVEAARSFRLGRHRLGLVAEVRGVQWWNDSKATNFHAVEAALQRFEKPVILLAGGKAKGGDIAAFVARIAPRVAHAVLIGDTKPALAAACRELGLPHSECGAFEAAVDRCAQLARPGDVVLLSPAFASFDMFRGYDHRGQVFEELVHVLQSRAEVRPATPSIHS